MSTGLIPVSQSLMTGGGSPSNPTGTGPTNLAPGDHWQEGGTVSGTVAARFLFLHDASVDVADMMPQDVPIIVVEGGKVTYSFEGDSVDFGYFKTGYNRDEGAPAFNSGVLMFGNVGGKSVVAAGEITDGAAYLTEDGDIKGGEFSTESLLQTIASLVARIEQLETVVNEPQ